MTEELEPTKPKQGLRIPKWVDKVFVVAGLALLVYVLSRYPIGDIRTAVSTMWPGVLVTPLIALAWFCCGSTPLYLLLDRRVAWRRVLWIRLVGDSYNALLPLAGFGGEPFKIRQLTMSVDPGFVMTTLIRDRIVDNAIGFLVSAASVAIGLTAYTLDGRLTAGLIGYAIVCGVLGILALALGVTRLPGRVGGWMAKVVSAGPPEQIERLSASRLLFASLWCLGARALGLLEGAVLLRLLDLPHDFATILFVDGVLNAAGYIGFMIPAGLGVFEGATVYVLAVIGATGPLAIAFALARRGRMLVVSLFGISLHLGAMVRRTVAPRG
ncbi:MAG TPA: lysylphosphatidylglycerol synthase domain-containing protein [Kofleriaceae bacterium]